MNGEITTPDGVKLSDGTILAAFDTTLDWDDFVSWAK